MHFSHFQSTAAALSLLAQIGSSQNNETTIKASSNVGAATSDAYPPASSK